jgi:hypothetical protein
MARYRNKLLVAASVVVAAGTVAISGLTAAGASQTSSHRATGTEHFQLVTTSAAFRKIGVIATGAFTAGGVDTVTRTSDTFKFHGGTFVLSHSRGHGKQSFDPRTCLLAVSQHGTFTLSHGTGAYAGISGHGKYTLSLLEISARTSAGKCSQTKKPVATQQIIRAQGPVTLK